MTRIGPPSRGTLILAVTILLPFLYILFYVWNTAADIPLRDDMYLIKGSVVEKFCKGTLTFTDLWRPTAGTRLLGYNLLLVANTAWFGLNSRLIVLLIPCVLVATALLIYRDYHKSLADILSPYRLAATYALPMLLLFSVSQWEVLCFDFGILFVLSVPWFLASYYALEDLLVRGRGLSWFSAILIPGLTILVFAQTALYAFATALLATFICYFTLNRRKLPQGFARRAVGIGCVLLLFAFLYLVRINENDYFPSSRHLDWSVFAAPRDAVEFVLAALAGSAVGVGAADSHLGLNSIVGLGLLVALGYVCALVTYFKTRMHERTRLPFFLITYALAFVCFMTVVRFPFGITYGMASRYTCSTVFGIIAIVWIAIFALAQPGIAGKFVKIGLLSAVTLAFLGLLWTSIVEWQIRPHRRNSFDRLRTIALHVESASDQDLAAFEERPSLVRASLHVLRQHRLSVYRNLPPSVPLAPPVSAITLALAAGGASSTSTVSDSDNAQIGYATLECDAGCMPWGTAVFRLVQSGNVVTEAAIPAVAPAARVRVFVDNLPPVAASPGHPSVRIEGAYTAIALVNPSEASALVTFRFRDMEGTTLAAGQGTLAPRSHIARLINQIGDIAPDFRVPADPAAAGTLEIAGNRPIAVIALRITNTLRHEALMTSIPVVNLDNVTHESRVYLPYLIDGGGYATCLMLLNDSGVAETGMLRIVDTDGIALPVTDPAKSGGSPIRYSIKPNGAFRVLSDGCPRTPRVGWVQITPDSGTSVPAGMAVISFTQRDELVSLSGIPAVGPTTHARIPVDRSYGHDTGLAIGNPAASNTQVTLKAFHSDGQTRTAGGSDLSISLAGNGHFAKFAGEFMPKLPVGFQGVVDVSSPVPFVALTLRSLVTLRNDHLLTAFPAADFARRPPASLLFPHIADGGGYATDLILLNTGVAVTATLKFVGQNGSPWAVARQNPAPATAR